jgi:copper chaperone
MNTVHYQVNGIVNNPIKTQVKNALEKIDGVQMVNIDLHRGSVEVGFNEPAKENEIRTEIEHVGCRIVS